MDDNGVICQFKEEGAEDEVKEMLASAKYTDIGQIKPTEPSTTKRSSKTKSSGISFRSIVFVVLFVILIVVSQIKRAGSKAGKKTKVISIRMADNHTDDDYDDDSVVDEDSPDREND